MPEQVRPKGKHFVCTEDGEALSVRSLLSNQILLPNGERVQVKRAITATAIAQSQTDAAFIAAPPEGFYIALLSLKVMCDAATLVTLNSKPAAAPGVAIDSAWPYGQNGGAVDVFNPAVLAKGQPGEALTLTTGAGGNTYARAQYVEVPINVDIL